MAYKVEIANEIAKLFKNAPVSDEPHTDYLGQFNQQDIADTMNYLHSKYQDTFMRSNIDYTMRADITFLKRH